MRSIIFIITFLLFQVSFSQEKTYSLITVDRAPVIFPCVDSKDTKECFTYRLLDHIKRNIDVSKTHNNPGTAYVQFIISSTGEIKNIKVRAKKDVQITETTRVISSLPITAPATLNGEAVAVLHSVPVVFQTEVYNSREDYMTTKIKKVNKKKDQ